MAPDAVNLPMIRHWVDALDDQNPVYLDPASAAATRHGSIVAPPAMLQTWTMARPRIEGIAERGGAAMEISPDSALGALAEAGYTATVATNSELEFLRYLRIGDLLSSSAVLESISEQKATSLGRGYFVTWVTTYVDQTDTPVGRQQFRVFRFAPGTAGRPDQRPPPSKDAGAPQRDPAVARPVEPLPPHVLNVTATVIVAGAIASRDFMPAHHDRDYARSQGAPDLFMNILTTNGYFSRYVTDWAGPEAVLERIAIRLGVPAIPGSPLRFAGAVRERARRGDEVHVAVDVRAENDLGSHAVGTVELTLPS